MKSQNARAALAEVTESQWGMVTSAQAIALGVSHVKLCRLVASGDLERLAHGVYKNAGAPGDEHLGLRAAWLSIEPSRPAWDRIRERPGFATVSGESAALLHGIGDLRAMRYEFTTPTRKQSQRTDVKYRTRLLTSEDVTLRHGLPVTTIERTIADLVEAGTDLSLVGDALRDATSQQSLSRSTLVKLFDPLAPRLGLSGGEALLAQLQSIAGVTPESLAIRLAQELMIVTPEKLTRLNPDVRARVKELASEMLEAMQERGSA